MSKKKAGSREAFDRRLKGEPVDGFAVKKPHNTLKKVLVLLAVLVVFVVLCLLLNLTKKTDFHEKYAGTDLSRDVVGMERTGTYKSYLAEHDAVTPEVEIPIDLRSYEGESAEPYTDAAHADAIFTEDQSFLTWNVDVPEAGWYNLSMDYLTVESRGVSVERAIYINGELPFNDAASITFSRIWRDGAQKHVDNQGNEIRPQQVESFEWQNRYFKDDRGYVQEPYRFYFDEGPNTLSIEAVNEPVIIGSLTLLPVSESVLPTYAEYMSAYSTEKHPADFQEIYQGEDAFTRSEPSLYGRYDRSSPTTQPNSVTNTILNYIGGDPWAAAGEWIDWEVYAPEDGFYTLSVKGRQNYQRGNVSSRRLYIDGVTPFREVSVIDFPYSNDWTVQTPADESGTPYRFYLTQGTHTVRLEATLGDLGGILEDLEDSTFRLNQIYRKILVYTGATPDQYRDYHIERTYPEIIQAMRLESKRLFEIIDRTVAYTGQKADQIASAQTVAQQLERFIAKPEKITTEFTTFKDNVTALGTSILNMSETKLDIDYIVMQGAGTAPIVDRANIFERLAHSVKSFFATFFVDYNAVGDVYDEKTTPKDEVIKVWILSGRDQGTILKSMIDDSFTPSTGVKVNVEIVAADAVLSAVMAGRGPNVILSVGADQPVNYALRGAAEDLTQFDDLDEVLTHFTPSSYEQYSLDGGVYGIPENQSFDVMFYRKDVLDELGLEVPNTWQDLIDILPTIQGNNLTVAMPSAANSTTGNASSPDLTMYFSMLYQNGADVYNETGTKTTVDSEAGVKAFRDYTRYFNDYGLPVSYDFVSRFRSGEMPIGIAAYSTYNTLMVSAPEIKGLWDFTLIPGTEYTGENGQTYIDRSDFISGQASMMIKTDSDRKRENSWKFIKWWTGVDTQVRFGREIEALLGSSARYATANRDAFSQLSWSARDIKVLEEQWDQTHGIREVPGGYYTGRHLANAVRKVLTDKDDPAAH